MVDMWKLSRIDATIWMVTALGVVVIDVSYGLIIGVLFAVGVLIYRGQHPRMHRLGNVLDTDVYVDFDKYENVSIATSASRIFDVEGSGILNLI